MFDQTFVDGVGKTHKSWTVTLSFGFEFLIVGVMILIPLIWTEALPKASLVNFLTAPAPPPPPPPPPPPQQIVKVQHLVPRQFDGQTLRAPIKIPDKVQMITETDLAPLNPGAGVVGGIDGGVLGGLGSSLNSIGNAPPPPPPPPKVEVVKPKQDGPVRTSSGVQAARCTNCAANKPQYPQIAKQARIQGPVVLQAIIAKDGTVQKLTVVSSANPLLTPAAIDAVKRWIYIPTILNNEPVEVITEITVNFSLQ